MTTIFNNKANILADLWIQYRNEVGFRDFVEYNDLGLPLAYAVANDIATVGEVGTRFIEETFDVLLSALDIEEDTGFETIEEMFDGNYIIERDDNE